MGQFTSNLVSLNCFEEENWANETNANTPLLNNNTISSSTNSAILKPPICSWPPHSHSNLYQNPESSNELPSNSSATDHVFCQNRESNTESTNNSSTSEAVAPSKSLFQDKLVSHQQSLDLETTAFQSEVICVNPIEEKEVKKEVKGVNIVKEIWMNEYSSLHKILLVGEGDFSFSASLAMAFGSATNMIATSLDSEDSLGCYKRAMANIQELKSRGCKVVHCVDATQMASNDIFNGMEFDRIVFNFPHAGFMQRERLKSELQRHQDLVEKFMENAKKMLSSKGEIHVRHKSNDRFKLWNLDNLGINQGLILTEELDFNSKDYPGYSTKRGNSTNNNFKSNSSKTYIFRLP